MAKKSNS